VIPQIQPCQNWGKQISGKELFPPFSSSAKIIHKKYQCVGCYQEQTV